METATPNETPATAATENVSQSYDPVAEWEKRSQGGSSCLSPPGPRVVIPHDYSNQADNFKGARGSGDQDKVLATQTPRVAQIEDALFGDTDTWETFAREKPVHRVMVEMSVAGYTADEIAKFTRYNPHHVRKVLRQPWARERMVREIKKSVQEEIKTFLEGEVLPALKRVAATGKSNFNDEKQGYMSELGLKCDSSIIERFLGKPVQPVQDNAKPPSEQSDDELKRNVESILSRAGTAN